MRNVFPEIFSGNLFPAILAGKFFRLPFRQPCVPHTHVSKCKEIPEVAEFLDVRFLTRSLIFLVSFVSHLEIEKEDHSIRHPVVPMP